MSLGIVIAALAMTGCGSASPDPDELPLVHGALVAAHKTASGDDHTHYTALVITGRSGQTVRGLNNAEVRYLVGLGWHARQYKDGTANLDAPDKKVWTFIGLDGRCAGLAEGLDRTPHIPYICASLGSFHDG